MNSIGAAGDSYLPDDLCDTRARPDLDPPIPPSGECTLLSALEQANVSGGTIEFANNSSYSQPPEFQLQQPVTLRGPASVSTRLTLSGNGSALVNISLSNLTITGASGTTMTNARVFPVTMDRVTGTTITDSDVDLTLTNSSVTTLVNSSARGRIENSAGTMFDASTIDRLEIVNSSDTTIGNGTFNTLTITDSANTTIRGNVNVGLGSSARGRIVVSGSDSSNVRIEDNVVSEVEITAAPQSVVQNNRMQTMTVRSAPTPTISGNQMNSLEVHDSPNTRIGGSSAERNVIGGLMIVGAASAGTQILGNYIGIDATGTKLFQSTGFKVQEVPNVAVADNVIATGFAGTALHISGGASTATIRNNWFGLDASGVEPLDVGTAILLDGVSNSTIGPGNIISASREVGVHLRGETAKGNVIKENFIGTDKNGTCIKKNFRCPTSNMLGIYIEGGPDNRIEGNIITGNNGNTGAVKITGETARNTKLFGNTIGLDANGAPLVDLWGNTAGILVQDAPETVIGGPASGLGNVISRNQLVAIRIRGTTASATIEGNLIGTDPAGAVAMPNGNGIDIDNSSGNRIGGPSPAHRNIISGNWGTGIWIHGEMATGNVVQGNFIGTDKTGLVPLGNDNGVILYSPGNLIGGTTGTTPGSGCAGACNLISASPTGAGIQLQENADETVIQGNYIGTDVTGVVALGNGWYGVVINTVNNLIGGPDTAARNLISGSGRFGVVMGTGGGGNRLQGNFIGTDRVGTAALPNKLGGLDIFGSNNLFGGSGPTEGNLISGNTGPADPDPFTTGDGIVIEGHNNRILGNKIGTEIGGNQPLGNAGHGVTLRGANNQLGGFEPGEGNLIAGNGMAGVQVQGNGNRVEGNGIGTDRGATVRLGNGGAGIVVEGTGNPLSENVIAFNGGLGIDLIDFRDPGAGVTANDANDSDNGGNQLQNFPVLHVQPGGTIGGHLQSTPDTEFHIELFGNREQDPSGHGEGEFLLATVDVRTGADGRAEFDLGVTAKRGEHYAATATRLAADGTLTDTSEFSEGITLGTSPKPIVLRGRKFEDVNGNGAQDAGEPGIPGWTIQLDLNNDGTIDGQTVTDADGNYAFGSLVAGGGDGTPGNINISRRPFAQSESAIAINPTDSLNVVAAPNDIIWTPPGTTRQDIVWFTRDGGRSWEQRVIPFPGGAFGSNGDPTLVFDRTGRTLIYAHMVDNGGPDGRTSLATAASHDGGNQWSASLITPIDPNRLDDRLYLTVGPDPGDPSKDRFYVTWTQFRPFHAIMSSSSGDGLVWSPPVRVDAVGTASRPVQHSNPAVGPDGTLYVVWGEYAVAGLGHVFFNASSDGGQTWRGAQQIYVTFLHGKYPIPAQPQRGINPGLSLDVDRSDGPYRGRIYLTVTDLGDGLGKPSQVKDAANAFDSDIFLLRSEDGGATWSEAVRVNDDPPAGRSSQFFPWLDVDQTNGLLAIGWHDARNDSGIARPGDSDARPNTATEYYATASFDGGVTFLPNTRISTGTSNARFVVDGNNYGDYTGLSFHNGVVYPMWADSSNSTGDNPDGSFDVYTARVLIIPDGTHRILEVPHPDYRQTAPAAEYVVTVLQGSTREGLDFGNFQLGTITGHVFLDANNNGAKEAEEQGLSGWQVFLNPVDIDGDGTFDSGDRSTLSDALGFYRFTGLQAGEYTVGEARVANWRQTGPVPIPPGTHTITVEGEVSAERYPGRDFGNVPSGSVIIGQVYEDRNANGQREEDERPLADWVVFIDGNEDGILNNRMSGNGVCDVFADDLCQKTDENGYYLFAHLSAGLYPVLQIVQPDWIQTSSDPTHVAVDGSLRAWRGPDFGNFRLNEVSGIVFRDANGDGTPSRRESIDGLPGWAVFLDANGDGVLNNPVSGDGVCDGRALERCVVSDDLGGYRITGIPPGNHRLGQVVKRGYVQTYPSGGAFHQLTVDTSGAKLRGYNFGNQPIAPDLKLLAVPPGAAQQPAAITVDSGASIDLEIHVTGIPVWMTSVAGFSLDFSESSAQLLPLTRFVPNAQFDVALDENLADGTVVYYGSTPITSNLEGLLLGTITLVAPESPGDYLFRLGPQGSLEATGQTVSVKLPDSIRVAVTAKSLLGEIEWTRLGPLAEPLEEVTISFGAAVQGFDLEDLRLTRNGQGNLLPGGAVLNSTDGVRWVLSNLGVLTAAPGRYELTVISSGSEIRSQDGTELAENVYLSWIHATPGDANLDGAFDSSDLVQVFQTGKYETGQPASFEEGDWNGDGVFDSGDLVAAFQTGRYEQPPAAARDSVFQRHRWDLPVQRKRPALSRELLDAVYASESGWEKATTFVP